MAEDERLMPPVVNVGEKIAASKTTSVYEQGRGQVLKEFSGIYEHFPRLSGESDDDYRKRRFKKCLQYIERQLENEKKASEHLPKRIHAPQEFHFIADGKDGFSTPFRIQKRVFGQRLKEVRDLTQLTQEQQDDLDNLTKACLENYRKSGQLINLIGSAEEEKEGIFEFLRRNWSPLENSNNIMLSNDGTIALIDAKVSKKKTITNAIQFFLLFAYLYRRRLDKLMKGLLNSG